MTQNLQDLQKTMFEKGKLMIEMADVFGALASDCRLEVIFLLLQVESLVSGEIARLTNCTPSQISQYLTKMHSAWILKKNRTWREIEYSLDKSNPFVQWILSVISGYIK